MFLYYNACVFLLNGKLGKSIDIFAKLCFRLWLTNVYTTVIYIYIQIINKEQSLLEKEQSQFPMLQTLIADKQPYEQLWNTALNFQTMSEVWMNGQ